MRTRVLSAITAGVMALTVPHADAQNGQKVLQLPIRTDGPKSLDPARGSTTYDNMACVQVYETLLVNKYNDPMTYEPLLLEEIPTSDDGGKTWHFKLKRGVMFYDPYTYASPIGKATQPVFGGQRTRELVADDVFYSLKRIFDEDNGLKNTWLLENTIEGLDEYAKAQNAAATFDYDAPVAGFRKISDHEFEIVLTKPVTRFLWILTMFQTSIVPREAVEAFGEDFSSRPVGTGPFALDVFVSKSHLYANRNPYYHDVRYPDRDAWSREDRAIRMHRPAGERVPFVDRIEMKMYVEDNPMWLDFMAQNIGYTEVPDEFFAQAFDKRTKQLRPEFAEAGRRGHSNKLLDFIFRGFNMEDPVLGGYSPERKALRQAISLAMDLGEFNETFYSGNVIVYDGPIPPGLDGYPEDGRAPAAYRGPNLDLAKRKLAEAGYPGGQGLAPIRYYANRGGNSPEQAELMQRQLERIGVRLDVQLVDFSTLIEFVNNKKAPMFSFAWSSDYPDGENNLALFYGPNESPGSNHFNYKRSDYDALYESILTMLPGSERTAVYEQMRDMILEDVPYIGSMARQRYYLINPWLLNCKPTERYWSWFKFLDVDDAKRPR